MAHTKNQVWSGFIARALAMLHAAGDPRLSLETGLNTHDQREFRQGPESQRLNDELAEAEIRQSLDNQR